MWLSRKINSIIKQQQPQPQQQQQQKMIPTDTMTTFNHPHYKRKKEHVCSSSKKKEEKSINLRVYLTLSYYDKISFVLAVISTNNIIQYLGLEQFDYDIHHTHHSKNIKSFYIKKKVYCSH